MLSSRSHSGTDALVGHRAALDVDRPIEQPGRLDRAAHLGKIAPDFHDDGGIRAARRSTRAASASVPGITVRTSSPQVMGEFARVQHPDMPVTPGTTSIGNALSRRCHMCMNEP